MYTRDVAVSSGAYASQKFNNYVEHIFICVTEIFCGAHIFKYATLYALTYKRFSSSVLKTSPSQVSLSDVVKNSISIYSS
jgi:hypothetical protein